MTIRMFLWSSLAIMTTAAIQASLLTLAVVS